MEFPSLKGFDLHSYLKRSKHAKKFDQQFPSLKGFDLHSYRVSL